MHFGHVSPCPVYIYFIRTIRRIWPTFPPCALSHLPVVTLLGLELQLVLEEVEYPELVSGAEVI